MKLKRIFLLVLAVIVLSGCMANIDKTGMTDLYNYSEQTIREKIVVGKTSKKEVLLFLGAPGAPADFKTADHWLYASKVVDRRLYFFIPVFRDKAQILLLEFDKAGVVSKMNYSEK